MVSADPEINNYIFQNEGKLVEMWYLDSFSKLFAQSGEVNIGLMLSVSFTSMQEA